MPLGSHDKGNTASWTLSEAVPLKLFSIWMIVTLASSLKLPTVVTINAAMKFVIVKEIYHTFSTSIDIS